LNNLAELHYRKGNYYESLLLQQRSLDINIKTFGQNHVQGASALDCADPH
jgi:hypothetical protein